MNISRHYDEISHCNKCGFCQVACPIFRSTGHESGVARGRLALIRAIIENRLEWSRELEEPLFDCLLCGACTANCFPAIPTSDLLIEARAEYQQKVGRKSIHRLLFDYLLPYPQRLYFAARAVALGKNTGLSSLAKALGLLRIFGRDFPHAEDIIDKFPLRPFRDRIRPGVYQGDGESLRIGYFIGCGVDIIRQDSGTASLNFLKKVGKTVHVLENCCCGLPAWSYGDLDAAQKLALKNLSALKAATVDLIVTDCSSCASFLKKYQRLFPTGDSRHDAAKTMGEKVRDIMEVLDSSKSLKFSDRAPLKVTYHDPCHASRGQGLVNEPRQLLGRLLDVEYIELPEADWCCGGAGSYALSHYALSRSVLDRKMENLKKTGAQVVVTSCPACMIQLAYGIRKHGIKMTVKHISEMVV